MNACRALEVTARTLIFFMRVMRSYWRILSRGVTKQASCFSFIFLKFQEPLNQKSWNKFIDSSKYCIFTFLNHLTTFIWNECIHIVQNVKGMTCWTFFLPILFPIHPVSFSEQILYLPWYYSRGILEKYNGIHAIY